MTNLRKIREKLDNLDALLLTSNVSRFYAAGFPSSAGAALIFRDAAYLLVDFRYIEDARAQVTALDVRLVTREESVKKQAAALLELHRARTVGFEDAAMTVAAHADWREALKGRRLTGASALLRECRSSKAEWEIDRIRAAQRIAEAALAELLGSVLREGVTERQVAAELEYRMRRNGADSISFEPIVAFGANSSVPHAVPGDRPLRRGDFATLDFGCKKDGYCSDMTRTVALGEVTDEMRRVYEIVRQAKAAGIAAAYPGREGREVHAAAAKVIEDAGYGEFFGHGFGHGLGLEVHENPSAAPSSETALPENAVISAEPGIYLPGRFGVRIEDTIALRPGGAENLMAVGDEMVTVNR